SADKKTEEVKERTAEVKKVLALGHTPGKSWAKGDVGDEKPSRKHGTVDSTDRKGLPKYPVGEDGSATSLPVVKLPEWMLSSGRIDLEKIGKFAKLVSQGT